MTDLQIQKLIEQELSIEPSVKAAVIEVQVSNGIVTLSGTVHSYAEEQCARRAALRVPGIKAVLRQLAIQPVKNTQAAAKGSA